MTFDLVITTIIMGSGPQQPVASSVSVSTISGFATAGFAQQAAQILNLPMPQNVHRNFAVIQKG